MKPKMINPIDPSMKIKIKTKWHDKRDYENRPISMRLPVSVADAAPIIANPAPTPNKLGGALYRMSRDFKYNRKFLRGMRGFTHNFCRKRLKHLKLDKTTNLTFDKWIESTDYSRTRKDELIKLRDSLRDREVLTRNKLNKHTKKHREVKSFIKDESYDEKKFVRIINSRNDAFKVLCGPVFAKLGKQIGKLEEFIKYVPVVDRPRVVSERLQRVGGRYFSSDYSSFEAHFTKQLMENCEFVMYKYMTEELDQVQKDNLQIIMNILSGDNQIYLKDIKISLNSKRMSGEMNTSLGNGFSNLMINMYVAELHNCGKITIFVEGDDGIMTFSNPENAPTEEDFLRYGFVIKLIESKHLADLSFCGQVFDPDDGIVMTDPVPAMIDLGYTRKRYANASQKVQLQLLKAKAQSMLYQYNGCPMLTAYATQILALTRNVTVRKSIVELTNSYERELLINALAIKIVPKIPDINAPCRQLFARLYGVSIPNQLVFEERTKDLFLGCEINISNICTIPRSNTEMYEKRLYPKGEEIPLPAIDTYYLDYLHTFMGGSRFNPAVYKGSRPRNKDWLAL